MTSKKWTIIISTILSLISIIIYLFLQFQLYHYLGLYGGTVFCYNLRLSVMTISSGIFTGAFVTLLISIKEYLHERKKALERLYFAANDILNAYMKLWPFFTDEPLALVAECLGEIDANNFYEETNKELLDKIPSIDTEYLLPCSYVAKKKYKFLLLSKMKKEDILEQKTLINLDKELDRQYSYNTKKYIMHLEHCIDSFLELESVSCREMTIIMGDLDFIFSNKTIRSKIYKELYSIVLNTVNEVKGNLHHFKLYKSGKGDSKQQQCHIIERLQNKLFCEDDHFIYYDFCYRIDTEMTYLLKVANGKKDNNTMPDKRQFIIHSKNKMPRISEENNA